MGQEGLEQAGWVQAPSSTSPIPIALPLLGDTNGPILMEDESRTPESPPQHCGHALGWTW